MILLECFYGGFDCVDLFGCGESVNVDFVDWLV